ncbi:MAG TPA: MFS transporter [Gaiellaceae bacterium]|nr:MFS transporter [Gaiellaceae bacterium]
MSHLAAPGRPVVRPRRRLPALLEPLAAREYALLWLGQSVSLVGDGVYTVAIAWQVYALSNAPTALAVVGIARTVPLVGVVLFAGALADRVDRRLLMIVGSAIPGAAIGLLAALALTGEVRLWELWAVSAAVGLGRAVAGPAGSAIVPELVPETLLLQANSLEQFVRPLAMTLAGPALGGVLVAAAGAGSAFALDAGSFGFAVCALLAIRYRPARRERVESSLLGDLRDGIRYVRGQTWIWGTLACASVWVLLLIPSFDVLVPYVVKNDLGEGARGFGLVFAAGGLGAIGAALATSRIGIPRRNVTVMLVAWGASCAATIAIGLAQSGWQAGLAFALVEALLTVGEIIWITLLQRLVPGELLGRVRSLDWLLSVGLVPLGFAVVGPIADAVGARTTLIGAGALASALALATLLLPGMREPEGTLA